MFGVGPVPHGCRAASPSPDGLTAQQHLVLCFKLFPHAKTSCGDILNVASCGKCKQAHCSFRQLHYQGLFPWMNLE